MTYAYLQDIQITRGQGLPVYLQISQALTAFINQGILKLGQKLPGSRLLAQKLDVNRNTITLALDELVAEGWLVAISRKGLFVNEKLPFLNSTPGKAKPKHVPPVTGFTINESSTLEVPELHTCAFELNDGFPDPRLSPLHELGREYHRLLKKVNPLHLFSYSDAQGDLFFRKVLSRNLNQNRGLNVGPEQVFICRGSIMGIYLVAQTILIPGDKVVVGELSYRTANMCFENCGAHLIRIPVDEKGIDTIALEKSLQHQTIRLLYVTSHHQHPTTVMLAPERRLHLYELAKTYRFCILEDDYDFEYHYENKPTLPIASMDSEGLVIYTGSYSKIIYPGIRLGFVVAPLNLIKEMMKFRRIVDRQGDHLVERAVANLMQDGTMQRYLRKAKTTYRTRKDFFCQLLRQDFSQYLDFREPEGGMAVWVVFKPGYPLPEIARRCRTHSLYLSDGKTYNPPERALNACRLGFASLTEPEMVQSLGILKQVLVDMTMP